MMHTRIAKENPNGVDVVHEDYELWTRLAPRYRLGNVPQILLKHRRNPHQTSVVYEDKMRAEFRYYRRKYFFKMYSKATEEDYAVIAKIKDKDPFTNIQELERAGKWLLDLAKSSDALLKRHMANRWRGVCLRSSHMGMDVYHLYMKTAPQFVVSVDADLLKLRWACALRLRPDSTSYKILSFWKNKLFNRI